MIQNPFPIVLICGNAGSGKDTVADQIISIYPNSIKIAQADEMKRFAAKVFKFTNDQLWGPSEKREEIDERYDHPRYWTAAITRFNEAAPKWLYDLGLDASTEGPLCKWFFDLPREELTPRYVLQTLGTEFGRAVKHDIWVSKAAKDAGKLLNGGYSYTRLEGLLHAPGKLPYDLVVISDGRFRNEVLGVKKLGGFTIKVVPPNAPSNAGKHQSESELDNIPRAWFDIMLLNNKDYGLVSLHREVAAIVAHIVDGGIDRQTLPVLSVNPNTESVLDI